MTEPGQALERRDETTAAVPLPVMNDAELAGLYRTARALAESGLFKDATQTGQAFAKILAGRDLGLTPFEAMSGLHVIEGKIEASSDLHATRVRQAQGLGFRVAWLKLETPPVMDGDREVEPPKVDAVWADEEDLADLRETYGCAVVFYDSVPEGGRAQDGQQRGVSRFTVADAVRAGLDQPSRNGKPSNHVRYPRNMFYARAMTNGVAWFVPEVMGGVRVYALGELSGAGGGEDLTAGTGDPRHTSTAQAAKSLPTAVEAIVARASELGHAGLANREAAAMATTGQPPTIVGTWVRNATAVLNRLAAGRGEPPAEPPKVEEESPPETEVVDGEPVDDGRPDGDVAEEARNAMRARLEELQSRIGAAENDPSTTADELEGLRGEAASLAAQLGAAEDPAQTDLSV